MTKNKKRKKINLKKSRNAKKKIKEKRLGHFFQSFLKPSNLARIFFR